MTRRPLNVKHKIVYVHMSAWGLLFLFYSLQYFSSLSIWFWGFFGFFCLRFWGFLHKEESYQSLKKERVCSLSSKYDLGIYKKAFGDL